MLWKYRKTIFKIWNTEKHLNKVVPTYYKCIILSDILFCTVCVSCLLFCSHCTQVFQVVHMITIYQPVCSNHLWHSLWVKKSMQHKREWLECYGIFLLYKQKKIINSSMTVDPEAKWLTFSVRNCQSADMCTDQIKNKFSARHNMLCSILSELFYLSSTARFLIFNSNKHFKKYLHIKIKKQRSTIFRQWEEYLWHKWWH